MITSMLATVLLTLRVRQCDEACYIRVESRGARCVPNAIVLRLATALQPWVSGLCVLPSVSSSRSSRAHVPAAPVTFFEAQNQRTTR